MQVQSQRNWSTVRTIAAFGVGGLMLVGLFPRFGSYADAMAVVRTLSGSSIFLLFVLAVASMASFWLVTAISLPGLSLGKAAIVKQSSTAVANTVAAGGAVAVGLTYTMLSAWTFQASAITRSVFITGIINNLAKIGFALVVLPFVPVRLMNGYDRYLTVATGVAFVAMIIIIFIAILQNRTFARFAGRLIGAVVDGLRRVLGAEPLGRWQERGAQFRVDSRELLSERWVALTISGVAAQLSLYVVLMASLRAVGVGGDAIGAADLLMVFAAVRVATALPLTPGGIGVAELGYSTGLTLVSGGAGPEIVAAVVVFRTATWLLPTLAGIITFTGWSISRRRLHAQAA
jgi:uncharacterized membrane protein YbhN (UPF0104 family)